MDQGVGRYPPISHDIMMLISSQTFVKKKGCRKIAMLFKNRQMNRGKKDPLAVRDGVKCHKSKQIKENNSSHSLCRGGSGARGEDAGGL